MPEMVESLRFAAEDELVIATSHYVANEAMRNALCAAPALKIVFVPQWFQCRSSCNPQPLCGPAGRWCEIHTDEGVVLHSKSYTMDGVLTLIGSANSDRRSFGLHF